MVSQTNASKIKFYDEQVGGNWFSRSYHPIGGPFDYIKVKSISCDGCPVNMEGCSVSLWSVKWDIFSFQSDASWTSRKSNPPNSLNFIAFYLIDLIKIKFMQKIFMIVITYR